MADHGYHVGEITVGTLGNLSKIQEELDEAVDAENQSNRLMVLLELSDIIGAVEAVLEKQFPGFTLEDLKTMSDATKRAFLSGHRQTKD